MNIFMSTGMHFQHIHKYNCSWMEENEKKPTLETVARNQSQEPDRVQLVWVLNTKVVGSISIVQ